MWKKIWEWLKKYGGYIAAFAAGIASYLFIDRRGDERTKQYIDSLTARLGEYEELIDKLEYNTGQLTRTINLMEATGGELGAENDKLRGLIGSSERDVKESRKSLSELQDRLSRAESDISKLSYIDTKLGEESKRVDNGFNRLEEFLKKYGTTAEVL